MILNFRMTMNFKYMNIEKGCLYIFKFKLKSTNKHIQMQDRNTCTNLPMTIKQSI